MKHMGMKSVLHIKESEMYVNKIPGPRISKTGVVDGYHDALEAIAHELGIEIKYPIKDLQIANPQLPPHSVRDYQRKGIGWVVTMCQSSGAALLADDMGLGKTRQAAFAAMELSKAVSHPLILVVCPASVRDQWPREWDLTGKLKTIVIDSGKRCEAIDATHQLIVVSYALVEKVARCIKRQPTVLICDEFHRVKGRAHGSRAVKRSVELKNLAAISRYRIGLTGTPMWSELKDFYQLLDILWPWRFGKYYDFDCRYANGHHNEYGFVADGASNLQEFQRRLSHYMLRRTKEEVAKDLPPLTRIIRWVEPDANASRAFRQFEIGRHNAESFQLALKATLKAKIDETVEVCAQLPSFLCLTWMKEDVDELFTKFNEKGLKVIKLTGDLSPKKRREMIDEAIANKWSVVATIASVGEGTDGLQLIASDGVFHSFAWVPAELQQAEGRLHRLKQTLPVTWTYIAMKESADEWYMTKVVKRLDTWQQGVAGGKDVNSHNMRASMSQEMNDSEKDDLLHKLYMESKDE